MRLRRAIDDAVEAGRLVLRFLRGKFAEEGRLPRRLFDPQQAAIFGVVAHGRALMQINPRNGPTFLKYFLLRKAIHPRVSAKAKKGPRGDRGRSRTTEDRTTVVTLACARAPSASVSLVRAKKSPSSLLLPLPALRVRVPNAIGEQAIEIGKVRIAVNVEAQAFAIVLARPLAGPNFPARIIGVEVRTAGAAQPQCGQRSISQPLLWRWPIAAPQSGQGPRFMINAY